MMRLEVRVQAFPKGLVSIEDQARLVALRRDFHRYPELAFDEHRTAERVEYELASSGYTTQRIAGTGVI